MSKHSLKVGDRVESRTFDGTYEDAGTVTHTDGRRSVVAVQHLTGRSINIESYKLRKIEASVINPEKGENL